MFGVPVRGHAAEPGLILREEFTMLLAKTQCVGLPRSTSAVREGLMDLKLKPFSDLPIDDDGKTLRTYGLVLAGIPTGASRSLFDAKGFVTRAEATKAIATAMAPLEWRKTHAKEIADTVVPADVKDPILKNALQTLLALDVLPDHMRLSLIHI